MKIEVGKTYVTGGNYGNLSVRISSRMVFGDTPVFYSNATIPGYWFEDGRHSTGSEAYKLVAEVPSVAPTTAPMPAPTPAHTLIPIQPPIQPPAPPSTVRDALAEVRAAISIMNYATKRLTAAVAGAQAVSAIDRAK